MRTVPGLLESMDEYHIIQGIFSGLWPVGILVLSMYIFFSSSKIVATKMRENVKYTQ